MAPTIPRIAIVTHALDLGGGAAAMTEFVYRILNQSGRYKAEVISLAQSSSDCASVRLRRPRSWRKGPQVERRSWRGIPFLHVGARWPEYEPHRYRARAVL